VTDSRPAVQALSAREAEASPDATLYEGVPPHLLMALQDWTGVFLADAALAHRVAATLRIALPRDSFSGPHHDLSSLEGSALLDVIDVALQLDEQLHGEIVNGQEENLAAITAHTEYNLPGWMFPEHQWPVWSTRARAVEQLDRLLLDGASAFQVRWHLPPGLSRRVEPAVVDAVEQTITTAPLKVSKLLRDAWNRTYGLRPDPTAGYHDAVRAVEEVACPLVLPTDGAATLGKVIKHLRDGARLWAFALVDRTGADTVEPLVGMLDRLWTGQVSRHGGGRKSREQTIQEAQAAVHLAVALVQLLGAGALTRRTTR
jgi:hypothetical protein